MISIIIPVYNAAQHLSCCIGSVLNQTYRDFELLLIDDGSTDGSGAICDAWAEKDTRIRVIHSENRGVSAARNLGMELSRGALLGFVDADDWCEKDMYSRLYDCLERNGADVAMCGIYDHAHGPEPSAINGHRAEPTCGFADAVIPILRRNGYCSSVCNKLFRQKVLFAHGQRILMDTAIFFGEDELWLFEVLKNCEKVSFLPQPLYHYRYQPGSLSHAEHLTKKQLTVFEAKKRTFALLPDDKRTQAFARGKLYTTRFPMKVQAYCMGDIDIYQIIDAELKTVKRYRWACDIIPYRRQLKFDLMDLEMKLGLPAHLVLLTDEIKLHKRRRIDGPFCL